MAVPVSESDRLIQQIHRVGIALGAILFAGAWGIFGFETATYVLLGILLSTLNALWLKSGIDHLLPMPSGAASSRGLVLFFLRLGLIMVCLYVTIRVSFMGVLACLAGLSVHVLAAMLVGLHMAYLSLMKNPR